MLKGALHIHSTYSDGEFTLRELRKIFTADGCAFACMTDHAEFFNEEKLKAYISECESLSDDRFRFIAGLEYDCEERMHILGYGVTSLVSTRDPQQVIRHIEREGGVSVIAHPKDTAFAQIEAMEILPHGIETWNTKSDGRHAPRSSTFRLLHRLQARKPEMYAFYGQDLHWKPQYRGLYNVVRCQAPLRTQILDALRRGMYFGIKGYLELPSDGELPATCLADFDCIRKRSERIRQLLLRVKSGITSAGLTVPAPLKSQLRRIFE